MSNTISASPTAFIGRRLSRRFAGNGTLILGIILAILILLSAFVAPFVYPPLPYEMHMAHLLQAPGGGFPLGTDQLGHNALAELFVGGYSTMVVALPSALITFVVGIAYGCLSGLAPSWLDKLLMRVLDVVLALPSLVVMLFVASLVALTNVNLILLLGFIAWPGLARLVRNEILAQRGRDFVLAAQQSGASQLYVARRHLLRVIAPMLVVNGTFLVADSILGVSSLSFLGMGVQPPQQTWGSLLQNGLSLMQLNPWWLILPPALLIFGSLLSASLIGEGLLRLWGINK